MASDGGPRAWAFLRRNPDYRRGWADAAAWPVFEAAPFPVRIQSQADREALAWGLLGWADPHGPGDNPSSPFWAEAPMLEGEWATGPPMLLELLARSGARLEGLRLADGSLILKIENRSVAVQVLMRARHAHSRAGVDADVEMGLVFRLGFGSGQRPPLEWFEELECLARGRGPNAPHDGDRELLTVLDGRLAGKSWREIAVNLYGVKRVAVEWSTDGWMRSRVRRRHKKARFLMEGGYRDLVAAR